MARNVEIKARLDDFDKQLKLAQEITGQLGERIDQRDIFFCCPNGRLKLRVFSSGRGELIFYQRADQSGPKTSNYFITRTDEPDVLRDVLERSYGVHAIVTKVRWLLLTGRTRIHLDQVDDLGAFLELEVVLTDGDEIADGQREAQQLMQQLQIDSASLIECAYVDLLAEQNSASS